MELNLARASNGFGASPIGYAEIAAWARLTGAEPGPFELDCIRRLDLAFISSTQPEKPAPGGKARGAGAPKP